MRKVALLFALVGACTPTDGFAQAGQGRRAPIDLAVRAALDAGQHPSVIV